MKFYFAQSDIVDYATLKKQTITYLNFFFMKSARQLRLMLLKSPIKMIIGGREIIRKNIKKKNMKFLELSFSGMYRGTMQKKMKFVQIMTEK